MPLNYDQQKNLRSLIDNAGAGTYEEVRNELYDHLVQATESRMTDGLSFTEAQSGALEEMGGEAGLVDIGKGYVKAAKRKVWYLFRAFLPAYLKSARCLLPLALGMTLNLNILFPIVGISAYLYFLKRKFTAWGYVWGGGEFHQTRARYPLSLRADILMKKVSILIFISGVSVHFLIGNGLPVAINIGLATLALILTDYSLAFVAHARKTWLEVA